MTFVQTHQCPQKCNITIVQLSEFSGIIYTNTAFLFQLDIVIWMIQFDDIRAEQSTTEVILHY